MTPPATAIGLALARYRHGSGDPTTKFAANEFWRATLTPAGPGTLHLRWSGTTVESHAWGPGADWLLQRVPAITGALDPGFVFETGHPKLLAAQRERPYLRIGASGTIYHEVVPTILGQRVTAGEALDQWRRLVYRLGDAAPGPNTGVRLPPSPSALLALPSWTWHRLGVEMRRMNAIREVCKHANKLEKWADLPAPEASHKLGLLAGLGPWTVGSVVSLALGDPDAIAVGDYHLKNIIVHALTGRARGTDEEMLELLQPYAGQRGRAVRLLLLAGHGAPKFGARQRVTSISGR